MDHCGIWIKKQASPLGTAPGRRRRTRHEYRTRARAAQRTPCVPRAPYQGPRSFKTSRNWAIHAIIVGYSRHNCWATHAIIVGYSCHIYGLFTPKLWAIHAKIKNVSYSAVLKMYWAKSAIDKTVFKSRLNWSIKVIIGVVKLTRTSVEDANYISFWNRFTR